MAAVEGAHTAGMADDKSVVASLISGAKLTADETSVPSILSYRGTTHQFRTNASASCKTSHWPAVSNICFQRFHIIYFSVLTFCLAANAHLLHGTASRQSQQQNQQPRQESSQFRRLVKSLGLSVGGRGPSLLLVATALLVILFISAALLLNRISSLQQRLLERPVIQDRWAQLPVPSSLRPSLERFLEHQNIQKYTLSLIQQSQAKNRSDSVADSFQEIAACEFLIPLHLVSIYLIR